MVKAFTDESPDLIRNFVSGQSKNGQFERDTYFFNLSLLQQWFKSAYSCRIGHYDDLYKAGYADALESFNRKFPRAEYLKINREIEYASSAPDRNQYLPLVLINTVIKISKALNNE